jgi:phytoene dehydrogenase-like protein
MTQKSIIIIGAGIAGLSAGCYAQMNGYKTHIFELHDLPGGLCTAWKRKGYIFDGCIHYLFGSGEGQPFNDMWREIGAAQGRRMVNHDEFQRITDGENTLTVYANPDRLEAHMLEISPADSALIRAFTRGVHQFAHFDLSAMYRTPKSMLTSLQWSELGCKMLPFVPALAQWANLSSGGFARKFKHPFVRRAVAHMFSWEEAPVMVGMMLLAYMHAGNAGFPTADRWRLPAPLKSATLTWAVKFTTRDRSKKY